MVEKDRNNENLMDGSKDKAADWAYYHLIAVEYAEKKLEAAKIKLDEMTSESNRDPAKYTKAYNYLRKVSDESQNIMKLHIAKAKQQLETIVPIEQLKKIEQRRKKENKCLERIFINKPEMTYPVEFKSADKI